MTAKFSGIEIRWYKLSISAGIGALYVIFSYVFLFYNNPMILAKIILSILMAYIAFTPKIIKIFFRSLMNFYIITFFIGGVSFGIAYFFNAVTIYEGGILYVEEFPVILVVIGSVISFILGKYITQFIKNKKNIEKLIYKIKIKLMEKEIELDALYDSGHNVSEPFTNYPVVIIEKKMLEQIIPEEIFIRINENKFDFDEKWKSRLRVIPISTVSNDKEILVGIKTDEFTVFNETEKQIKNVVVAICNKKLSKEGTFNALIGKNLLDH